MSGIGERRKDIIETNETLDARLKDIEELYREMHHNIELLRVHVTGDENLSHIIKIEEKLIVLHERYAACMGLIIACNERGLDSLISTCLKYLEERLG